MDKCSESKNHGSNGGTLRTLLGLGLGLGLTLYMMNEMDECARRAIALDGLPKVIQKYDQNHNGKLDRSERGRIWHSYRYPEGREWEDNRSCITWPIRQIERGTDWIFSYEN